MQTLGWRLTPAALGALLLGLGACGGGCGDGGLGAGDMCGPPTYGYAEVEGTLLQADGSPAAGRRTFVSCGDVVGAYSQTSDGAGRFAASLVYGNIDTVLHPHPPRDAGGAFLFPCAVHAEVRREVFLTDSVVIPFAPTQQAVTTAVVELREP